MTSYQPATSAQWIELISKNELPAITSTALMLDRFSNDDKSSLPKLSQAILHDQGLSSCLLKVANSTQRMGVNKVSTVSRATVVLGIHAVKNICLTSKLVEGLLNNDELSLNVFNHLTQLMANSFYAGLLAKMMLPDHDEDTQEEVYLAAMLYRIGESAFWSTGGDVAEKLLDYTQLPDEEFELRCLDFIGTNFNELSIGLANKWNLGELLLKSLDNPQSRTVEMQTIYYADKLSAYIANPTCSKSEFEELLENIAQLMNINIKQLKARITQTKEHALKLLSSYGASLLIERIKDLPKANEFNQTKKISTSIEKNKDKLLLDTFSVLTQATMQGRDLNKLLQVSLVKAIKIFDFERCSFFMLTNLEKQIKCRFSYNAKANKESLDKVINLALSENIFTQVIQTGKALLINEPYDLHWHKYMTQEVIHFINNGVICCIPVKIGDKIIGVICGQLFADELKIDQQDFNKFCALLEHLNMCLTMVSRK